MRDKQLKDRMQMVRGECVGNGKDLPDGEGNWWIAGIYIVG